MRFFEDHRRLAWFFGAERSIVLRVEHAGKLFWKESVTLRLPGFEITLDRLHQWPDDLLPGVERMERIARNYVEATAWTANGPLHRG